MNLHRPSRSRTGDWWEYGLVALVVTAVTVGGCLLPPSALEAIGFAYLLGIILLGLRVGRWPMLAAGLLSALCWDFFFIPPRFGFQIRNLDDGLLLLVFFVVALVAGQLTAEIRAQARRERIREESEKLTRTLLDSVSHELRTPLAVITAALDNFDGAPPPVRSDLLMEMRTATRRLNRLVRNLLDQTRLESGTLRPRMEWCDAHDLVNAAVDSVTDAFTGRPFSVGVPDDMPPILADFTLTEHALANLLLNAVVHTPPGTPVTLRAGMSPDGARVFFAVEDWGKGLPGGFDLRLRGRFDRTGATNNTGLGLGLSIVRGFMAAQGGDLTAEGKGTKGALFTVYLPHSSPQPDPT
jgi:two-component system, OmpR family, sensor histidine kinase KdpD